MMQKKGFTLIELLVVIAIIGLLSAIILASLSGAHSKGRDTKRIADINQLQLAVQLYFDANSNYPPSSDNGNVSNLQSALVSTGYISVMPADPSGGTNAYGYFALPSGCDNSSTTCTSYVLGAQLENPNSTLNGFTSNQAITINGAASNCDATNVYCVKP